MTFSVVGFSGANLTSNSALIPKASWCCLDGTPLLGLRFCHRYDTIRLARTRTVSSRRRRSFRTRIRMPNLLQAWIAVRSKWPQQVLSVRIGRHQQRFDVSPRLTWYWYSIDGIGELQKLLPKTWSYNPPYAMWRADSARARHRTSRNDYSPTTISK